MEDLHKNPFQSQPIRTADLLKDQESQRAQARNFSFEKMRLNFQDDKSNVETSDNKNDDLLQKLKSVEGNLSCQDHPDEEIQFYSFTNDRALCSECILSGLYTGCEVLSLKKAGDRIRPKFQELLKELTTKTEQLNLLQGGSENKANQGSSSDSKVKDEIKAQFDKLRAAIDKKEKEILAKYNVEENEAPSVSTADKALVLKQMQEKISEIQEVLNSKLKTLKEVDLCQYYHDKSKLVRDFLNGECTTKIKDRTRPALSTNAREQPNPNEYKDAINKLIEAVNNLKEKAPDDFKSKVQSLQSRFSSNPEPEREKEKSEILIENGVSPPALLKLMSNISEGPNEFPVRPRSVSPFRALRKELEIISPLPVLSKEPSSPGTATEENLRRLLDRVEDMKKGPLQGNRETKKETKIQGMSRLNLANIQTQSMARLNLFEVNGQGGANVNAQTHMHTQSNPKLSQQGESLKEKDPTKKFWETYKELIEDQNSKKKPLTNSTAKLGDVEKNKPVPRSFIPDFAKSKLGLGTASETYGSPSKYSSPSSQGLASTKNLRSVLQDDTKQASAWRLQAKRDEERRTPNSNASKSFGTNSLSTNLRKLKKEMGLDD